MCTGARGGGGVSCADVPEIFALWGGGGGHIHSSSGTARSVRSKTNFVLIDASERGRTHSGRTWFHNSLSVTFVSCIFFLKLFVSVELH